MKLWYYTDLVMQVILTLVVRSLTYRKLHHKEALLWKKKLIKIPI
jgi:hypothetical protein